MFKILLTKKKLFGGLALATAGTTGIIIYSLNKGSPEVLDNKGAEEPVPVPKKEKPKDTIRNGSFTFGKRAPEVPLKG